jgi:Ulp1 family protease
MTTKGMSPIQRGKAITFRLPSDTPDYIIKHLQKLKETERRNFSSTIAEFALEGVSNSLSKERETLTIPLPKQLSKEQRNWLKHSHSEALLGSIVYQLLSDPVRATSILASLNSNALDIDEALYLQENSVLAQESYMTNSQDGIEITGQDIRTEDLEDDLENFDWAHTMDEIAASRDESPFEDEEADIDDLLGGFLANMNK